MNLYERYPALAECRNDIDNALEIIKSTYSNDGKILVCGNGGSCADSDHIVGELMKSFTLKRKPDLEYAENIKKLFPEHSEKIINGTEGALQAISLPAQVAVLSAFANDVDAELVYAQLTYGYGRPGDTLICLSTSGNSGNVVYAAMAAKARGLKTIALTGHNESRLSEICDATVRVPETETYKVQEYHLPIYHYLCAETEKCFFGNVISDD